MTSEEVLNEVKDKKKAEKVMEVVAATLGLITILIFTSVLLFMFVVFNQLEMQPPIVLGETTWLGEGWNYNQPPTCSKLKCMFLYSKAIL